MLDKAHGHDWSAGAKEILHVSNVFDGGISRAVSKIAQLTPEYKHHLLAYGSEVSRYAELFESVSYLPPNHIAAIRRIRLQVKSILPDIVHAHSSWAGMYCRVQSIHSSTIYQPHCYVTDDLRRPGFERAIYSAAEHLLSLRQQCIVTLSPHETAMTQELYGYRLGRVHVQAVPNVPTIEPAAGCRARYANGDNAVVAMIGRLCHQKDPEYFLDLINSLREAGYQGRAVWIGDGDKEMRAGLEAAGVTVTGWVNGTDLQNVLESVTVYVHTARYEGFPLSVLDALAFGIPVLGRAIACFDETGIDTHRSIASLAAAVQQTLSSESEWNRQRARSGALLDDMNEDKQREALIGMYESYGIKGRFR